MMGSGHIAVGPGRSAWAGVGQAASSATVVNTTKTAAVRATAAGLFLLLGRLLVSEHLSPPFRVAHSRLGFRPDCRRAGNPARVRTPEYGDRAAKWWVAAMTRRRATAGVGDRDFVRGRRGWWVGPPVRRLGLEGCFQVSALIPLTTTVTQSRDLVVHAGGWRHRSIAGYRLRYRALREPVRWRKSAAAPPPRTRGWCPSRWRPRPRC